MDWQRSPNFGLCACVKTTKLFSYVRLVGKYAFFDMEQFSMSTSLPQMKTTLSKQENETKETVEIPVKTVILC